MAATQTATQTGVSLRHTVATLAYRAAKVLRDTPPGFSSFHPVEGARSAGEILAHLSDLFDWALSQVRGKEVWQDTQPRSWTEDTERFFAALTAFDNHVALGGELHAKPERVFQGAVADALTHVGQIALLRRLAGARIRAENYYEAQIEIGRTGANQPAPVSEFD